MNPQQDPGKEFEKQLKNRLSAIDFDFGEDSPRSLLLTHVLRHHSLSSLNCEFDNYNELVEALNDETKPISVYLVAYIFNGFEKVSPERAGLSIGEYRDVLKYVHLKGIEWNEIVMPIKTSIMRKMESDANLGGRIIKPNKGLKIHK